MEPEAVLALALVIISGAVSLSWTPIGKALTERLRRSPRPDPAVREGMEAELQALQQRVAELEERLDFAERLLARQREGQQALPRPGA
ncbi:MAG: hypothetical protein ACREL9_01870 [Gemmatimonadales bacterium]